METVYVLQSLSNSDIIKIGFTKVKAGAKGRCKSYNKSAKKYKYLSEKDPLTYDFKSLQWTPNESNDWGMLPELNHDTPTQLYAIFGEYEVIRSFEAKNGIKDEWDIMTKHCAKYRIGPITELYFKSALAVVDDYFLAQNMERLKELVDFSSKVVELQLAA